MIRFRQTRSTSASCARLAFLALSTREPAPAKLVGAAPVYDDPRCNGAPVYFSEVVVQRDAPAKQPLDLLRGHWVYNDRFSLNGYVCVLRWAERLGFAPVSSNLNGRAVGRHLAAASAVAEGRADFAALDQIALAQLRREHPAVAEKLHSAHTLGPHPVQPVVARAGLDARLTERIAKSLLAAHSDPATSAVFRQHGLARFGSVTMADYTQEAVFGEALATTLDWQRSIAALR
jgi:phosphonate transport system substrate-binding protein